MKPSFESYEKSCCMFGLFQIFILSVDDIDYSNPPTETTFFFSFFLRVLEQYVSILILLKCLFCLRTTPNPSNQIRLYKINERLTNENNWRIYSRLFLQIFSIFGNFLRDGDTQLKKLEATKRKWFTFQFAYCKLPQVGFDAILPSIEVTKSMVRT